MKPTRLLVGPAGTGKTHRCLAALRACERTGTAALLIVPDQFTYTADRLLLADAALAGTRHVRVVRFRRLVHWIASDLGQDGAPLSEEGRRLLLRAVVHDLGAEALGPLAPVRDTPGLVASLALAIAELKGLLGREAQPRLAALAGGDAKLTALARILAAYDERLTNPTLQDPGHWIHALAAALAAEPGAWRGRRIWIDGFMSFTPEERTLLAALATAEAELTITLCVDGEDLRLLLAHAEDAARAGLAPFSLALAQQIRGRLRRPQFLPTLRTGLWLARELPGGIALESLPAPPPRFAGSPALAQLEAGLFRPSGAPVPPDTSRPDDPALRVTRYPTPYHEVVGWARAIDRRARLEGDAHRYRDHAVLVRDLEAYRPLVREVFRHYGIPHFIDERRDIAAHPLMRLLLTALRIATQGWSRELIATWLRNPLHGIAAETCDRIENLALAYGIEYERWLRVDWAALGHLPPREARRPTGAGLAEGEDWTAEEECEADEEPAGEPVEAREVARRQAAAEAAAVSARLFPPLDEFARGWGSGNCAFATGAAAVRRLLSRLLTGRPDEDWRPYLAAQADAWEGSWDAEETAQIADLLAETLVLGERLMGAVPLGAALFARLLRDSLSQATIGVTPQSLDAVTVAEPRRSRINEAPFVILGGATAAAFPRLAAPDPIFSDAEREALRERGFPIGAHAQLLAEEDAYLFYIACTRAGERLWVTYPTLNDQGAAQEPSSYLAELGPWLANRRPALRTPAGFDRCQHRHEWEPLLGRTLAGLEAAAAERVKRAATAELAEPSARAARYVERLRAPGPRPLPAAVLDALHPGGLLRTSASQLERFGRCPFAYFAHYVLRLEPRPEAVLTPLSTGSAVHRALERFFAERPGDEAPAAAAQRIGRIFAALAREEEFRIFQADPPSAYRWQVTGRELQHFIATEGRRLRGAGFQPRALELAFGLSVVDPREVAHARQTLLATERVAQLALPALDIPLPTDVFTRIGARAPETATARLRGRIDRLDLRRDRDDELWALVLDYKRSARSGSRARELQLGLDLQIATYMLAVRKLLGFQPAGGFYYAVTPRPRRADERSHDANPLRFKLDGFFRPDQADAFDPEEAYIGSRARQRRAGNLDPILAAARRQIELHGARILSGEIRPLPVAAAGRSPCEQCDYRGVCRYDPTAAGPRAASDARSPAEREA